MLSRSLSTSVLERLREGRLEIAEGGHSHTFGPPDSALRATVRLHDSGFWEALPRGSRGLAASYAGGSWDCDDLVSLVRMGDAAP
jgi:cyclopropane-fatty-acyl-phospholipid synthase